jgi:hypothetical protein
MTWLPVDSRLLRQDHPSERRLLYWDADPWDYGQLFLWEDTTGDVTRFQLTHRRFPSQREYVAEWHRDGALRLGAVLDDAPGISFKPAPQLRYGDVDEGARAQLTDHFTRNALVLAPRHRDSIARVLAPA